ncbi:MAG: UvrD-helicase domain-containing protein [bacterium]|nr:UvrD-helicase domain-containing protein [bacterium]MDE0290239.1 UvrD-helicase domain-containing protein [bacterium]MDE0437633.1 UvrD-helicase domain-containing protein [bacterium]
MTKVATYDPHAAIGGGGTIIEASAGTGKTFTIAAAVTRLVAEEGVPLDRILVVTFTRAATAELKDRVRRRMVVSLRTLRGDGIESATDDHMRLLLESPSRQQARHAKRLDRALTQFDRAQIFTIHGFAGRLLQKLGFRSRLPADLEPGEIDELVVRRAAGDLVVRLFAGPAPAGVDGTVTQDDLAGIGKAVVSTPDVRIVPEPSTSEGVAKLRARLATEMKTLLSRRLRAEGRATFDETLVEARDALTEARIGAGARELLRRRYSIALVDEAQDTDPIQWQILRAVFDESRLVVIGDPKQSIYAFRGADIESYLSAADRAATHRTLETNWRSDGPLVAAIDAMLAGSTFGDDRIGHRPVQPAGRNRRSRISGTGPPLEVRRISDDFPLRRYQFKPFFYVGEARGAVAADLASETVRLLTSGVRMDDGAGPRAIGPGDVAVLCRTGRQVATIREELMARAVPSVVARTGSVFNTDAAEQWRRFLLAVERPSRTGYLRLAATTVLYGMTHGQLAGLPEDAILALRQRFVRWQALLHDHGVPTMFADIDRSTRLTARILARSDGERELTDLTHIAEEMHSAWRGGRIGSLVLWIEAAMDEAIRNDRNNVEDAESRQRRLDTDAAAVQVLTIHAAKGLEYPVVMVPYLWDMPRITPRLPVFHDPEPGPPGEPRGRLIDVGGPTSPGFESHQELAKSEEAAEEGRLLYVALTRARHRMVVWWVANTQFSARTKLHQLLTRGGDPDREIQRLIEASGGTITQTVVAEPQPVVPYPGEDRDPGQLERARLDRPLDYFWRRVSFSSLSPDRPLGGETDTQDEPDRVDEPQDDGQPTGESGGLLMEQLPRGARFGSLVHEVLQSVPFDAPDLAGAIRSEMGRLTRHSSWDFEVDAFVNSLVAAIDTPLGAGDDAPTLRDLDPARTLKEMDFELPLRTSASTIALADIARVALDQLPRDDPHRGYFARLGELESHRFRGFLTGGIDLITVLSRPDGDRYVVMDFKSNTLPTLGEVPDAVDYGPEALTSAMHHGNYVLQALLYQVALHRYLEWRLDGYDPSRHLGGSIYLFVRGMIGAATPVVGGERCGVARWFPPARVIAAVSDLFAGHRS